MERTVTTKEVDAKGSGTIFHTCREGLTEFGERHRNVRFETDQYGVANGSLQFDQIL